jgi:hypothetical protein
MCRCEYIWSPRCIGGGVYRAARPRVDETNSLAACQVCVQLFGNKRAREQVVRRLVRHDQK